MKIYVPVIYILNKINGQSVYTVVTIGDKHQNKEIAEKQVELLLNSYNKWYYHGVVEERYCL